MDKWIKYFEECGNILSVFYQLAHEMKLDGWIENGSGFTVEEIELIRIVGDEVHVHFTHMNCIRYPISDFMNRQGITFNLSEVLVIIEYLERFEPQDTEYNKLMRIFAKMGLNLNLPFPQNLTRARSLVKYFELSKRELKLLEKGLDTN